MEAVKQSVRAYWDKQAPDFDNEFGHGLRDQRHRDIWLDILRRNIGSAPPAKILDVGCGTGFLSLLLSEMGHQATGLDFAPEMLAMARRKADDLGLSLDLFQGDAENPPFPENMFDWVICRHLVWTLPHPDLTLANWRRLLVPGGAVVLIEGHWRSRGLAQKLRNGLASVVQTIEQRKFPEAWEKNYVTRTADLPLFGGRPSSVVSRLLEEAGFRDIWKDPLEDLVENETASAPLSYRIRHARRRERRFLLGGRV